VPRALFRAFIQCSQQEQLIAPDDRIRLEIADPSDPPDLKLMGIADV